MPGLVIENLHKSFDGKPILGEINIETRPGELMVVLGPSGCGKSTLLRLISGLETADSGKIILDDRDITGLEPQKRKTAMVFQNYALYPHMTVFDNIGFPLKVAGLPREQIRRAVEATARLLELDTMLDRRPAQLSGGQRQRVALGRGLIREPSIFLLDEPLSNLDAALRVKMRQEIVSLQKRLGITMIYVTHDQTEALTMADRMVVLRDGHIHQIGTPADIYNNPQDLFVASFIGTPAINLFEDKITSGTASLLPIMFDSVPDGKYTLAIRPEHIRLEKEGDYTGVVVRSEYIGAVVHLRIKYEGIDFNVVMAEDIEILENKTADRLIGRELKFGINPEKVHLFETLSGQRVR